MSVRLETLVWRFPSLAPCPSGVSWGVAYSSSCFQSLISLSVFQTGAIPRNQDAIPQQCCRNRRHQMGHLDPLQLKCCCPQDRSRLSHHDNCLGTCVMHSSPWYVNTADLKSADTVNEALESQIRKHPDKHRRTVLAIPGKKLANRPCMILVNGWDKSTSLKQCQLLIATFWQKLFL